MHADYLVQLGTLVAAQHALLMQIITHIKTAPNMTAEAIAEFNTKLDLALRQYGELLAKVTALEGRVQALEGDATQLPDLPNPGDLTMPAL